MRITVLWTELTGYLNACLRQLVKRHGVDLLVYRAASPNGTTPTYDENIFAWLPRLRSLPDSSKSRWREVYQEAMQFHPDAVLVSGWTIPAYRLATRRLKQEGIYVISAVDNPWRGTARQWLGAAIARRYLHTCFDAMWVPGERAAEFAHRLGFIGCNQLYGLYSADSTGLGQVAAWRLQRSRDEGWPRRFLFVGRYVASKGLPELLAAYKDYRRIVSNPWDLWCAGSGPLAHMLENEPGVRSLGFVQPGDYSEILKEVGVFVLPSRYDNWGVVVHEAASAGLPVLCTRQCGSSAELVQDGFNGFLFDAGDVKALGSLLRRVTSGAVDLAAFGQHSACLSARYSSERWADYLVSHLTRPSS